MKSVESFITSHKPLLAAAIVALVGFSGVLLVSARHEDPDPAALRAAELAQLRFVAGRLIAYARKYHRPAYYLDSVPVHLDPADAAEFRSYLTDLWGDSIRYSWGYTTFRLSSRGGVTRAGWNAAVDSARRSARRGDSAHPETAGEPVPDFAALERTLHISEEYQWPEDASRKLLRPKLEWYPPDSSRSSPSH
jgi:hypothetical protein